MITCKKGVRKEIGCQVGGVSYADGETLSWTVKLSARAKMDRTDKKGGCVRHFSPWSACSVTCGIGISHRTTNNNNECLQRKDTRLCQLRPCETVTMETGESTATRHGRLRRHRHCRSTVKSFLPAKITDDGNCTSVRAYRSTFCGMCDGYQCCQPQLSTTVKVRFRCGHPDGENENIVTKNVMFTVKCVCTDNC
ncbi:CCN family member 2-like [Tachypleus tridentatus]|uniref:CCN family member 2-like n=1 Tax=Tachypleus tridentatus TaxID=6853 RepID=UPI003FD30AA8